VKLCGFYICITGVIPVLVHHLIESSIGMLRCLSWPLLTQILLLLAAGLAACSPLLPQGAACWRQCQPVCKHHLPMTCSSICASQLCGQATNAKECSFPWLLSMAAIVATSVMHVSVLSLVDSGICMASAKHMRYGCI